MAEDPEKAFDFPVGELREITLLIPGEHFFCETLSVPPELNVEDFQGFAQQALDLASFSPYPSDQLAWGFHGCEVARKITVFATPFIKLRQLGWQNLEFFRRVVPSFVSLMARKYESATITFLLHDETLTAAAFDIGSAVPEAIYSLPVDPADQDDLESVRGQLLAMFDLSRFGQIDEILTTGEVHWSSDGVCIFEDEWLDAGHAELDQSVAVTGEEMWDFDIRPLDFKVQERKQRRQSALLWKLVLGSGVGMAAMLLLFIVTLIGEKMVQDQKNLEIGLAAAVPDVVESIDLLKMLEENKRGGIDPIRSLTRLMAHVGRDSKGDPTVYLVSAEFRSRYELALKGKGRDFVYINGFYDKLLSSEVIEETVSRPDMETQKDGWVSFKVTVRLRELPNEEVSVVGGSEPDIAPKPKEG